MNHLLPPRKRSPEGQVNGIHLSFGEVSQCKFDSLNECEKGNMNIRRRIRAGKIYIALFCYYYLLMIVSATNFSDNE